VTSDALPDFPFRRSTHDRLGERRTDDGFLAATWSDPRSLVVVMRGVDLAATDDGTALTWTSPAEAPDGERMLLGVTDNVVRFVVMTPDPAPEAPTEYDEIQVSLAGAERPTPLSFSPLRRLAQRLSDDDASYAVHATALAHWHLRHPRCSVCGAQTEVIRSGEARHCPQCGADHFPRTDPAVIMTVVDDEGRCLLGHNSARADGWFSTLAGFVEPGESPEQAVVREVHEEVGVQIDRASYLGSQPWPFPSSLMLGFEAHASSYDIQVDGNEITEARWFTRAELRDAVEAAEVGLPTTISIAGALITRWYGEELPANRLTI
jgi:NAD+ diphosphatase